MTLILTLGNVDQVIQISDRRLSWNGITKADESNKSTYLRCVNARMAIGYTGLATLNDFITQNWLLDAIVDSGPPDCLIGNILEKLRVKATETFNRNPDLANLEKKHKLLSIMFSGYFYSKDFPRPRQGNAIITNYQNFNTGQDELNAWDEFVLTLWQEKSPANDSNTLIQRIGNWHSMSDHDVDELRTMLIARKPSYAITDKAVELVREIADRPTAQGTIGKELTSIMIPIELGQAPQSDYRSSTSKNVTYMPDQLLLLPDQVSALKNISFRTADTNGPPFVFPKVKANSLCPCGSGKKFKYCHGKALVTNKRKRHKPKSHT